MKILHRYILWQILLYTALCMGVFIFVLVAGKVIRDGAELLAVGRVSFSLFLELFGMLVLYVFTYALPLGLLTAILLVLGRLSAQREIVAIKAAGISLYRIAVPIFFIAIIGTILNVLINTYLAPLSKSTYKYKIANVFKNNPGNYIQKRSFIKDFPGYMIYVEDKDGDTMKNLWVWEINNKREVTALLKADEGLFSFEENSQSILLTLHHGSAEKRSQNIKDEHSPILIFDELPLKLPLQVSSSNQKGIKYIHMLTTEELLALKKDAIDNNDWPTQIKIQTEIQKDFATAFSVFSLVVIAIPLGIKASRKETYANLALAVLLAGTYYTLLIIATWFDDQPQYRPDLIVWAPNILFQALGLIWLIKANKN